VNVVGVGVDEAVAMMLKEDVVVAILSELKMVLWDSTVEYIKIKRINA
jgi:hypothetical protein